MKFFAVMFVWNEDDVIAATVKHVFSQGFERVFVIDNGSTDDTVREARKAGAEIADIVETRFFVEEAKLESINAVIKHVNERDNDSSIWWLIVDADEFPDFGLRLPIRCYLEQCGPDVNVVGADLIDHMPTHPPYAIPGYDPAFFQPYARTSANFKIPLIRYDKGKPHIKTMGGARTYLTEDGSTLIGPDHRLTYHHYVHRTPGKGLARLKLLTGLRPDGTRRVDKMEESRQRREGKRSHYWDRFEAFRNTYAECADKHIWNFPGEIRPAAPSWHTINEVPEKLFASGREYRFWKASALLYAGEYREAMGLFRALAGSGTGVCQTACLRAVEICRAGPDRAGPGR